MSRINVRQFCDEPSSSQLESLVPCNGATSTYEGYPNHVLWLELKVRQQSGGRSLHDAKGYASFVAFP